jgi:hypothetical protein
MANTTNFNWETPDDTDLVKDGAAAIRTLGSSIDTTTKNLNPSTTLGDIEYRSSTANTNTRLGIGTTGQVLTVAGGVPSWASPAGGGKVLQVVNATYSTAASSSSASFADTGLTATITPTLNTSKVLVIVSQTGIGKSANDAAALALKLLRGATDLVRFEDIGAYTGEATQNYIGSCSASYLDSPATTSATTYKTQFANRGGSGTVTLQASYGGGLNPASTITLMEIGA